MNRDSRANDSADLVVVGSGIIGLGAAYAAVRRGLTVIVVDRADAPVGATIRNFGHLCIGAQTGDARRYADLSRDLWLRLAHDAGFWLRESGTRPTSCCVSPRCVRRRSSAARISRPICRPIRAPPRQ